MRWVGIAAALILACSSVPPQSAPPVELCRSAFPEDSDGSDAAGWLVAPVMLPLVWIFGPERVFDWLVSAAAPAARRGAQQRLLVLQRAAEQGHLPSGYLLARESSSLEGWEPPLDGVLSASQRRTRFRELAEAGFPPGELTVANEAAEAGFRPYQRRDFASDFTFASKRWEFFELATRAALRGYRSAWRELGRRYGDLIDHFGSSPEDRAQGYAWTYLETIPVSDFERQPDEFARLEERQKAAWARLRDDAERDHAQELARRYEAELFPPRLIWAGEHELCSAEPQFRVESVEIPVVYNPVHVQSLSGGAWARPPSPPAQQPPPPVPPPGVRVVSGQIRTLPGGKPSVLSIPIALEQSGRLERIVARVRDAAIFSDPEGFLFVQYQGGGISSSFAVSGPQWVQKDLREFSLPNHWQGSVGAYCEDYRASTSSFQRESKGCTVDLEWWIRPPAPP